MLIEGLCLVSGGAHLALFFPVRFFMAGLHGHGGMMVAAMVVMSQQRNRRGDAPVGATGLHHLFSCALGSIGLTNAAEKVRNRRDAMEVGDRDGSSLQLRHRH